VTELYCGRSHSTQATGFALRVRAKSRMNNLNDSSSASFESWKKGGQNWLMGVHRDFNMQANWRNLSQPGVHYGKSSTNRNCLGENAAATSTEQCCSGYYSATTGKCLPPSSCILSGVLSSTTEACCSHQRNSGGDCL
jgi:hypothetical protein